MHCPRLKHYVKLNPNSTVGRCGHMTNARGFPTYEQLEESEWLAGVKSKMDSGEWPEECTRCQQIEIAGGESVRKQSIQRHKLLFPKKDDYLIVGGMLDNVCNSACQTCKAELSTKIGSLENKKDYVKTVNEELFYTLPQDRIVELDVSGGEPTASPNYKKLLGNLPTNVRIVRLNTNGSKIIPELEDLLKRSITVIVTLSLDGVGVVHDYVRWPIKWDKYVDTVDAYIDLRAKYKNLMLDFWTTVSCLNIGDLQNIKQFAEKKNITHSFALLSQPAVYNVKFKNQFTEQSQDVMPGQVAVDRDNSQELENYINRQDRIRNISIIDYLNLGPNLFKNN